MTVLRKNVLGNQDDYLRTANMNSLISLNSETISEGQNVNSWNVRFEDQMPSRLTENLLGPDDDDDDDDLIPIEDDDDDDLLPDGGDDDLSNDDDDDFLAEEADDDLLADNDDDTGLVDDDEDDDYDGDVSSVGNLSPPSERSHGRTTGRSIDHEPGTTGGI